MAEEYEYNYGLIVCVVVVVAADTRIISIVNDDDGDDEEKSLRIQRIQRKTEKNPASFVTMSEKKR